MPDSVVLMLTGLVFVVIGGYLFKVNLSSESGGGLNLVVDWFIVLCGAAMLMIGAYSLLTSLLFL